MIKLQSHPKSWLLAALALAASHTASCRNIKPPAPMYDVEPQAEPEAVPVVVQADPAPLPEEAPPTLDPVVPVTVKTRSSLCEELTNEISPWEIERGAQSDYSLCRTDRPVEDIEVGFRLRHADVELDILIEPREAGARSDVLDLSLTNAGDSELEIQISCVSTDESNRSAMCKRYQPERMSNFDLACSQVASVEAGNHYYELELTISPAMGHGTQYSFTLSPDTPEC